jgi:hypothetical protein
LGPPVRVGWGAPAAEAAACPRAASFGPSVWFVDSALELEFEWESPVESRSPPAMVAQITSAVAISVESLLGRALRRAGVWGWVTLDILASFGPGRLARETIRESVKGAVTAR